MLKWLCQQRAKYSKGSSDLYIGYLARIALLGKRMARLSLGSFRKIIAVVVRQLYFQSLFLTFWQGRTLPEIQFNVPAP